MASWDDVKYLANGASVVATAIRLHERFTAKKPELDVTIKATGNSMGGPTFTVLVSEVKNELPAMRVHAAAEIADVSGVLITLRQWQPFNLSAGQLDYPLRFEVPAPEWGGFCNLCGDKPTVYGRELVVSAQSENRGAAVAVWREERFDPEMDRARYDAMEELWQVVGLSQERA